MAYVYLQWDRKRQQTSLAVLASMLVKLRPASKTLTSLLQELYNKQEDSHLIPEAKELKKILNDHGRRSDIGDKNKEKDGQQIRTHARFIIFLDGLDEADVKTRQTLTSCIDSLDS